MPERAERSEATIQPEHQYMPLIRMLDGITVDRWASTGKSEEMRASAHDGMFIDRVTGFTTAIETPEGELGISFEEWSTKKMDDDTGRKSTGHRIRVFVPGDDATSRLLEIPKLEKRGKKDSPETLARMNRSNEYRVAALELFNRLNTEVTANEAAQAQQTLEVIDQRFATMCPPNQQS